MGALYLIIIVFNKRFKRLNILSHVVIASIIIKIMIMYSCTLLVITRNTSIRSRILEIILKITSSWCLLTRKEQ